MSWGGREISLRVGNGAPPSETGLEFPGAGGKTAQQGGGGDGVRIRFTASKAPAAVAGFAALTARYGQADTRVAEVIVALGGDGFMLQTLHAAQGRGLPVYGMNCGTIGFLMNSYAEDDLPDRLREAEETAIHPLAMRAENAKGKVTEALAINEVSLLRQGPQAAKLRVLVDGRVRLPELACDGALVATPAGSTAYNYSAHGPILPIGSDVLALTAMSAFRPRRWRGALLPSTAVVRFEVIEGEKRPVMADADSRSSVRDVIGVEIRSEPEVTHRLMFDPGHGLEERLIGEQFT
jgi:NAD+ kinase